MPQHAQENHLVRNILYNVLGQAIPMIVAFIAVPILIRGLGVERFGVLSMAWVVVGYFSLFDMGLGRATTKFVSEYIATGKQDLSSQLISTSLLSLAVLGLFGGLIAAMMTSWAVNHLLHIPPGIVTEATNSLYMLAVSIPLITVTAGARGVLEGQHRFRLVNTIKVPASMLMYLAPIMVFPFSRQLDHSVFVLVVSRFVVLLVFLFYCMNSSLFSVRTLSPSPLILRQLVKFGGWLTVTNVIGPLMTYMDRFVVGGLIGVAAVSYYTVAFDMISRLLIISGSLLGVLFPIFSSYSVNDRGKLAHLFENAVKFIAIVYLPVIVTVVIMAEPFLNMWLGKEFAINSTSVMQILSLGILVNSISQVPYSTIQAIGKPEITARIHLAEFPIYIALIYVLARRYGIAGVACAWVIRVVLDGIMLFWASGRVLPEVRGFTGRLLLHGAGMSAILLCAWLTTLYFHTFSLRIASCVAAYAIISLYAKTIIDRSIFSSC